MREVGVCRQRIANAIRDLKAEGRIDVVMVPRTGKDAKTSDYLYEVKMRK
ncbi:MAG: hypothetical protein MJ240_03845 [Kiritimatiellae bacterium]|nr:hypothetical protein [Kiritimatiellia bacterium]